MEITDADYSSSQSRRMFAIGQARMEELRSLLYEDDDDDNLEVPIGEDVGTRRKIPASHKLSRMLIEFTATLSLIDFMAFEPHGQTRDQNTRMATLQLGSSIRIPLFKYQVIEVSEWGRRARRKVWPYLLPLIWLAWNVHVIYILYYRFSYDYNKFRLARVRWLNRTQGPEFNRSSVEREDYLLDKLDKQRRYLQQIGAPNIHLSFVQGIGHVNLIILVFTAFTMPIVYFKYVKPFGMYFFRNLYDYREEQRHNRHFVQLEVRNFVHSIRSWSKSLFKRCVTTKDDKVVSPGATGHIDCATIERSLLCKQLEEMLAAGHLRPLNQQPKWVESWHKYYICFVIFCYGYAIFLDRLAYFLRDRYHFDYNKGTNIGRWLHHIEDRFWTFVNHTTDSFSGAAKLLTCRDQINLVNKLRKLLALTMDLNELHSSGRPLFDDLNTDGHSPPNGNRQRKRSTSEINRNILLFLIHYRLFLAQFDQLKRSLTFIVARSVLMAIPFPLLGRIFAPYLEIETMQQMRSLIFVSSCLVICFNDIYLVPVCYLNKRCADLYRELNYLLAHLMQIDLNTSKHETFENHDRHILISILRKELSHHDQAMQKFTLEILGFKFTFNNLISFHVYLGVLVLATMGENLAQIKEPTGTIFTDPLGLF